MSAPLDSGIDMSPPSQDSLGALTAAEMRALIAQLSEEVESLRECANAQDQVAERLAQLREANQHLVIASVSADLRCDEANQVNRRQNEFLAMLAHELRNPLAPISMAAALLERVPDASPQLKSIRSIIGRQVEQMASLLDDLLDAARISSGKIALTLEPLVLQDAIEQAVEAVTPRITERNQSLVMRLTGDPVIIDGSRVRLTQVFSNLLGNASKYTQDGGTITISMELAGGQVRVRLEDNGTGIAPDVVPHIFDLFTQGPRSLVRAEGGLGIGLNVVQNLVQMHGGAVLVHSAGLGKGSEFVVELPVSSAVAALPPLRADAPAGSCCRIVLVEDNVDACDTLHALLVNAGHTVRSAYDGIEGLHLALSGPFDVLVSDIGLPGLDGFSLIRRLRKAIPGRLPYAIALSGYCQPEDRQQAHNAGFDAFMVKPAAPEALLALIAKAVAPRGAGL